MWSRLIDTRAGLAPTVLRLALGLVMFPHGAQKLFGWFGGGGLGPTIDFFGSLGMPAVLAVAVTLVEFFGSLALIAGALSRVAALGIAGILAGAVLLVHAPNGFFMNWYGTQAGEGFEYHVLAIALAVAIAITGSGRFSVDRALSGRRTPSPR